MTEEASTPAVVACSWCAIMSDPNILVKAADDCLVHSECKDEYEEFLKSIADNPPVLVQAEQIPLPLEGLVEPEGDLPATDSVGRSWPGGEMEITLLGFLRIDPHTQINLDNVKVIQILQSGGLTIDMGDTSVDVSPEDAAQLIPKIF